MPAYTLLVQRVGRPDEVVTFDKPTILIGREAGDLVMGDGQVSSRHAEISWNGGRLVFRDLGSTNGSFREDGQRITAPLELAVGQSVRIGQCRITVRHIDGATAPGRTMAAAPPRAPRGTMMMTPGQIPPPGARQPASPPAPPPPAAAPPPAAPGGYAPPAQPPAPAAPAPAAHGGWSGSAPPAGQPGAPPAGGGYAPGTPPSAAAAPAAGGGWGGAAPPAGQPGVPPAGGSAPVAPPPGGSAPGAPPPAAGGGWGGSAPPAGPAGGPAPGAPPPAAAPPSSGPPAPVAAPGGAPAPAAAGPIETWGQGPVAYLKFAWEGYRANLVDGAMTLGLVAIPAALINAAFGWIPIVGLLVAVLVGLAEAAFAPLSMGALGRWAVSVAAGRSLSWKDAWRAVFSNTIQEWFNLLVISLVMAIGFLLLIVPGILLGVFAVPAYLVERKSLINANMRSLELVQKDMGPILVVAFTVLIVLVPLVIANAIVGFVLGLIPLIGTPLAQVLAVAMSCVVTPMAALVWARLYVDVRARVEGADVEGEIAACHAQWAKTPAVEGA